MTNPILASRAASAISSSTPPWKTPKHTGKEQRYYSLVANRLVHPSRNRCSVAPAAPDAGVASRTAAQNHRFKTDRQNRFCSEDLENRNVDLQPVVQSNPLESAKLG